MQYPVRIAHVIGKVALGGVDNVVMNYYRHIDRTKVQFDFFMDGFEKSPIDDEIERLGGRIFKLTPYDSDIKANLQEFRKVLNEEKYKVVHCHMNTLSILWLREAKRAGVPVRIAHSHSAAHWGEGMRTVMKYSLRPFSRIYPTHYFACGEYSGRWLFGNRLYKTGNITIIPNAIDVEKFRFNRETRERVRSALGIQNKFVVGHVGRFVYQKNHHFLIEVFNQLHKQKPDSVLLLVGDGKLKHEIERMVARLGLTDAVLFIGSRCDVHELYQAMDLFLLPSFYEGFGIVALEAQAVGLPCVISDKVPDAVIVTEFCIKIPLNSQQNTWVDTIIKANKPDKSVAFMQVSEKGYDIKIEVQKLERLYEYFSH